MAQPLRRLSALAALVAAALALHATAASAALRRVPADHPTIQQAINAAVAGDTVLVSQGTYLETINFLGKQIVVTSASGPAVTIIDANHAGSVVRIVSGEERTSVLEGFTIQNGAGDFSGGGGVAVLNSSPTIRGNVIRDCTGAGIQLSNSRGLVERNSIHHNASSGITIGSGAPLVRDNDISDNVAGSGGGIDCSFSDAVIQHNHVFRNRAQFGSGMDIGGNASPTVEDNLIENNVGGPGAGMELFAAGTPTIRNNTFRGNDAGGSQGGGMWIVNASDALIVQNLFVGNNAREGGGIYWLVPSGGRGPRALNNTFALNTATNGSAIFADGFDINAEIVGNVMIAPANQTSLFVGDFNDQNLPHIRFNDVFTPAGPAYGGLASDQTGLNGNISSDPLFRDATRNFRLRAGSPCLDAGDNAAPDLPATDLDGQPRRVDANNDQVAAVDMGAYEFSTVNLPPIADAGGPYAGDVDSAFTFNGTRSLDPDEDSLTYVWDFGDGNAGVGAIVGHKYAALGTYRVVLTVSDGSNSDSDTTAAQALDINSPPHADAGGPYSGLVGQPITFDGRGSSDPEGDTLSYHWDFGDGGQGEGPTPVHAYPFAGTFIARLEVHDATGVSVDTATVNIRFAFADLFVTQTHSPDPAVVGRPMRFSLRGGNHGEAPAEDTRLQFAAFNTPFNFTSITTTRGTCTADAFGCCVSCSFGTFAPGDSVRVEITAIPAFDTFVSGGVTISSQTQDANFQDNSSSFFFQVLFSAEQRLTVLIGVVDSLPLKKGPAKLLIDKLDAARQAVTAGDTSGACTQIAGFRQRLAKQVGHGITLTQAFALDQQAAEIMLRLGCGGLALGPAETLSQTTTAFAFKLGATVGSAARAELALPAAGDVRLDVFDINGRHVDTAFDGPLEAGEHALAWSGRSAGSNRAPAGVYFLRLHAGAETRVARFVLLR